MLVGDASFLIEFNELTHQQFESVTNGGDLLVFFGRIEYVDELEGSYSRPFCRRYGKDAFGLLLDACPPETTIKWD